MLLRIVLNKRLCYSYSALPKLFNRRPVAIARQWTVAIHGELAAGRSVKENNLSNESSKRMTNEEF